MPDDANKKPPKHDTSLPFVDPRFSTISRWEDVELEGAGSPRVKFRMLPRQREGASLRIKGRFHCFLPEPPNRFLLGRSPECDVIIAGDPQISRRHAQIRAGRGEVYWVQDLGSINGTYLNGKPVYKGKEQQLVHGDELALSDLVQFVFEVL